MYLPRSPYLTPQDISNNAYSPLFYPSHTREGGRGGGRGIPHRCLFLKHTWGLKETGHCLLLSTPTARIHLPCLQAIDADTQRQWVKATIPGRGGLRSYSCTSGRSCLSLPSHICSCLSKGLPITDPPNHNMCDGIMVLLCSIDYTVWGLFCPAMSTM